MSNPKLKSENYQNFGGMNSKASPYVTGPMEFLNLVNLDFQTPGSLTQRWGSTMYVGQTFSAPPSMLAEFTKLNGSSYVIIGTSVGIWFGATTGQSQGMSFTSFGMTGYPDLSVSGFTLAASGQLITFTNFVSGPFRATERNLNLNGDPNLTIVQTDISTPPFARNTTMTPAGANADTAIFENYMFAADGRKMWKFDGVTTSMAQLIPPLNNIRGTVAHPLVAGLTSQLGIGLSGFVGFYASYTNSRGVEGPIWPICVIEAGTLAGDSAVSFGGTLYAPSWLFFPPVEYGISSVSIYSYYSDSAISIKGPEIWSYPYNFLANYPIGYQLGATYPGAGATFTEVYLGTTFGGLGDLTNNALPPPANPKYIAMGISYILGPGDVANNLPPGITALSIGSYSPQYLEIYQNRLFIAGFSSTPSTVWFSDTAEPEGYLADYNFEVRTNDGDVVTSMKAYSTRLYIFKRRSMHVLMGDNPNNFFLSQVTEQYGCINNNSALIYDDILVFLDQKGLIMWNGANLQVLSAKIQPVFDTMNYAVAVNTACMVHDKLRNQVLVAIPTGNSTSNNITLVYDYLVGAWTTQNGFTPSVFAQIQGRNNTKNAFYGDTAGRVNWFGSSFLTDNGAGFTTYLKTRFLHDMGDSTQKMFRRLFLNTDSPASSTLVFGVNFFQDYGSSAVLGTTMVLSQFQNRIDYGVSAKSLAFELSNLQSSLPIKIHGFTIESRFLRRV